MKRILLGITSLFCSCFFITVQSNPMGEVVVSGADTFVRDGSNLTINQNTQSTVINWNTFNISKGQTTNFKQPNSNAVAVNRVVGGEGPSKIYGTLTANGRIILINQAGIYFGPSSQVFVGSIIASTSDMKKFDAKHYVFDIPSQYPNAAVVNRGTIKATDYGLVALIGNRVENDGNITAHAGTVILGAGNKFTLDFAGDQLLNFSIDEAASPTPVHNNSNRTIKYLGLVHMSGIAAEKVLDHAINTRHIPEAKHFAKLANGDLVFSNGTIDVSGTKSGQHGGKVKLLATRIKVKHATINARGDSGGGEVLIGGNSQGHGPDFNATQTYADAKTVINANATNSGNGGKVIVWSNDDTRFYGTISANGGASSGNGGLVETSGGYLDVSNADIKTLAPQGKVGTWLLDPTDLTISSSANNNIISTISPGNRSYFVSDNSLPTSILNVNTLIFALGSTNVTVTSSGGGTGGGTGLLIVSDPITWSNTTSLTLNAFSTLQINNNIINSGTGNIILSGSDIAINAGNISTNGNVSLTGTSGTVSELGAGTISGALLTTSSVGGTKLNNTNTVSNFNATNTGSGNISFFNNSPLLTITGITNLVGNVGVTNAGDIMNATNSIVDVNGTGLVGENAGIHNITLNSGALILGRALLTADTMNFDTSATPAQIGGTGAGVGISAAAILQPATASQTIGIAGGAGGLQLTEAMLNDLRETNVRIGRGNTGSGNIDVGTWTPSSTFAGSGQIELATTGTITQSGPINLSNNNASLLLEFPSSVTLTDSNNEFSHLAAIMTGTGSLSVTNKASSPLTIVSLTDIATANGISAPGGINLVAPNAIILNAPLSNGGGTTNTPISLTSDSMTLTGTIIAGAGDVNLTSSTPSLPITLGTGASGLGLSNLTLNEITTTGTLTIGDIAHNGTISTDGVVSGVTNPSGPWIFETNSAITLGNAITPPNSLTLSGTVNLNNGGFTTSGNQIYNGTVNLGADSILNGSDITFNSNVIGNNHNLQLIDSGVSNIDGAITGLANLQTDAVNLNNGGFTTSGDQTYNGPVSLGTDTNLNASGNINFLNTLQGNFNLTLNASGLTTFDNSVNNLASLSILGNAAFNTSIISTNGHQGYNENITLGGPGPTTFTSINGDGIFFAGTINGPQGVIIGPNSGSIIFNSSGDTTPVASVLIGTGDPTIVNPHSALPFVTTTGSQTYNSPVQLAFSLTFNTTNSPVNFASTVDTIGSPVDLTINAGSGSINIGGDVGLNSSALGAVSLNSTSAITLGGAINAASLTTSAGAITAINGANVTTSGSQIYNGGVTLGTNTTFTGTDITLNNVAGGTNNLIIDADAMTFNGGVNSISSSGTLQLGGQTAASSIGINGAAGTLNITPTDLAALSGFSSLTIGQPSQFGVITLPTTTFNFPTIIQSTGGINVSGLIIGSGNGNSLVLNGPITLVGPTSFVNNVGGNFNFLNTITGGGNSLSISTLGTTVFDNTVMDLSSLTTENTAINTSTISTSGSQVYGAVSLGADATLSGSSITFTQNVLGFGHNLTLNSISSVFGGTVTGVNSLIINGTSPSGNSVDFSGNVQPVIFTLDTNYNGTFNTPFASSFNNINNFIVPMSSTIQLPTFATRNTLVFNPDGTALLNSSYIFNYFHFNNIRAGGSLYTIDLTNAPLVNLRPTINADGSITYLVNDPIPLTFIGFSLDAFTPSIEPQQTSDLIAQASSIASDTLSRAPSEETSNDANIASMINTATQAIDTAYGNTKFSNAGECGRGR